MALAIATDKVVGWIVDAVLLESQDCISADQVEFACTAAREAVVSVINGGMYDDNLQLSHTDAPEPTLATRVGHSLPQLHHTEQGNCVITAKDMSLAMNINGSSLSPAVITWGGKYVSPKDKAPEAAQQHIVVTQGVHTSVGIFSSAGARTPYHVEQRALGACNMLWYGHGKVWELPDRDSLLNKVPDQFRGADPTPALYSKCMWSTWSGEPKILAKLGVTRVLQPPGYMMLTMPVSSSQLHAYLLP